ncbi:hypothetical protein [Sorangium sp. So ce131]|uniref:hypothetical protein n=1 Tax=Sorangium sp. So ce131 TaxID=3133282 RepID=UPI003F5E089A
MNVTDKLDLDGMLNDWPAPAHEEAVWEARAGRIVEKALSLRAEGAAPPIDLLATPDLAPEPGEAHAGDLSRESPAVGEHSIMAYGSDGGGADKPEASLPSGTSKPAERKRPSLKEIAERASQSSGRVSGVPALSSSGVSTPLPSGRSSATATPLPSGRSSATPVPSGRSSGISTPLPPSGRGSMPPGRVSTAPARSGTASGYRASSPSLRPGEATGEDSGVIDLNRLSASANADQAEAAQQAQPRAAEASDDDKPAEVAVVSARAARAEAVQPAAAQPKKGSGGRIAGAAIAALGLAAAVTMMLRTKDTPREETASTPIALAPAAPAEPAPAKPAPAPQEPAAPAVSPPPEQEEPAAAAEKLAAAPKAAPQGAAAAPAPAAPGAPAAPAGAPQTQQGKVAAAPAAPGNPGDLSSAMQAAVGSDGAQKTSVESEAPEPASGPLRQQNIPEQPSQGSVQAALGSVMASARACVAGADDVTRAQLTFSSSGQVTKVSVSGWAAANGQSSCVQAAFKGANVGPFSKPSFSVSATVRP